jgi:hypothetical protein
VAERVLPYSASFGNSCAHAQKTVLTASQNDVAAKSGTTLSGAFALAIKSPLGSTCTGALRGSVERAGFMVIFANACDWATAGKANSKYTIPWQNTDIIYLP